MTDSAVYVGEPYLAPQPHYLGQLFQQEVLEPASLPIVLGKLELIYLHLAIVAI